MINDAVLYSYRRPEMTEQAIQRLLNWSSSVRVHVSIDGLRVNASNEERVWREETIRRTESIAESNSNVIPHIWDTNNGLTDHAIRIFDTVFENTRAVFSLEEDNDVSEQGLTFLAKSTASGSSAGIASACALYGHHPSDEDYRFTLFPQQWGTALNLPVYEKFREIWFSKKIDRQVTSDMLSQHFKGDQVYRKLVIEKWHRIFLASVQDKSYGDALMTYAAFSLGTPYQVPLNSYVKDLGRNDSRGLHPRLEEERSIPHQFLELKSHGHKFCSSCERLSSGIPGNGFIHLTKYLRRRCSSILGITELQPQK